jgi:multiple sugar transport system permease protein
MDAGFLGVWMGNSDFVLKSPVVTRAERRRQWRFQHRDALVGWAILLPIFLYFIIFYIIPVVLNFLLSFTQWNGITGQPLWTGFDNYLRYLQPPYPLIIGNTFLLVFAILIAQVLIAFFVALLLNAKVSGRGVYRTLWYIPTVTSAAIMAQMATIFISPYGGILNNILVGMGHQPIIWTTDPGWMRIIIIVYSVWRGLGVPVVLFLAGLQSIHRELYEAAMVDGASGAQLLRRITIPLIKPMTLFVVVTQVINNFQIFEAVLLISKGGPRNETNVMLLQIYNDAFTNLKLGQAAAGAMILMLILVVFTFSTIRLMNRQQAGEHVA